jgi:hypothetical protein
VRLPVASLSQRPSSVPLVVVVYVAAVEYHVVNVFDKRGHELEFVCGTSALFWATCYSACGARHFELFSTPLGPCSNDESPCNSCLEGWHFLGSTHGASALQAFAG